MRFSVHTPVTSTNSWTVRRAPQSNIELMAKKEFLDLKPAPRPEQIGDKPSKQLKECEHRAG
jgi:hypothetical protein